MILRLILLLVLFINPIAARGSTDINAIQRSVIARQEKGKNIAIAIKNWSDAQKQHGILMVKRAFGYFPCTAAEKADARKWIAKRSIAIVAALLVTAGVITGAAVVIKKMKDRRALGRSGSGAEPRTANDNNQSDDKEEQKSSADDESLMLLEELRKRSNLKFYDENKNFIQTFNGNMYVTPTLINVQYQDVASANLFISGKPYSVSKIRKIQPIDNRNNLFNTYSLLNNDNGIAEIIAGGKIIKRIKLPLDLENAMKPTTRGVWLEDQMGRPSYILVQEISNDELN